MVVGGLGGGACQGEPRAETIAPDDGWGRLGSLFEPSMCGPSNSKAYHGSQLRYALAFPTRWKLKQTQLQCQGKLTTIKSLPQILMQML